MKKIVMSVLRIVVSGGLLGFLIYKADLKKIYEVFGGTDYVFCGLAIGAFLVSVFLLALRWKVLLLKTERAPGYFKLVMIYFIGYFFNNFLPTTIGGDVVRAYQVAKVNGNRAESLGVIFLERIIGLLATLTLATLAISGAIQAVPATRLIILTLVLFAVVVGVLLNLFNVRVFNFISRLIQRITIGGIGERIARVLSNVHEYRNFKWRLIQSFALSLMCQFLFIVMNYFLAIALGLYQVSLMDLMLVVPITFVMGLLPSINGIGVRETGYVLLLAPIGVSTAEALSLSFMNFLLPMALSLIGGILILFQRDNPALIPVNNDSVPGAIVNPADKN